MSDALTQTQEPTPGESGGRTFTQDEVNRIVSDRLAREREKLSGQAKKDEREKALEAREARLDCREYLDTQGYPAALLDVLDSSDTAKFKTAVENLVKAFPAIAPQQQKQPPTLSGFRPGDSGDGGHRSGPDPIAAAFKPKI